MAKLDREDCVTIKSLIRKSLSNRHIIRLLHVSKGAVGYHRRRQAEGKVDGRSAQSRLAAQYRRASDAYFATDDQEVQRSPVKR